MCLNNVKVINDLHFTAGLYDLKDMIQHMVFIAEKISDDAVNQGNDDEKNDALINLTSIVRATAYIAITHEQIFELQKEREQNEQ